MNLDNNYIKKLLKIINIDSFNTNQYSYLKINHNPKWQKGPGVLDQTYQFFMYLKICYCLNLKLELPKRYLASQHIKIGPNKNNKKMVLDFYKYLDFENSLINNSPISNFCIDHINEKNNTLSINPINYENLNQINKLLQSSSIESTRIFHPNFKNIANKVKNKYYKNFNTVIHIRRGDCITNDSFARKYLKVKDLGEKGRGNKDEYERLTSYKNVLKKLRNHKKISANDPIYVMSDMLESDPVIDGLNASEFNFSYYYNYPELQKLKIENNYDLFLVEDALFSLANFKISKGYWLKD